MVVTIRGPVSGDSEKLKRFFARTINDAFRKNGFPRTAKVEAAQEVWDKMQLFREDLRSSGRKQFFLLAEHRGRIFGTVAVRTTTPGSVDHHFWVKRTTDLNTGLR